MIGYCRRSEIRRAGDQHVPPPHRFRVPAAENRAGLVEKSPGGPEPAHRDGVQMLPRRDHERRAQRGEEQGEPDAGPAVDSDGERSASPAQKLRRREGDEEEHREGELVGRGSDLQSQEVDQRDRPDAAAGPPELEQGVKGEGRPLENRVEIEGGKQRVQKEEERNEEQRIRSPGGGPLFFRLAKKLFPGEVSAEGENRKLENHLPVVPVESGDFEGEAERDQAEVERIEEPPQSPEMVERLASVQVRVPEREPAVTERVREISVEPHPVLGIVAENAAGAEALEPARPVSDDGEKQEGGSSQGTPSSHGEFGKSKQLW